jgi:hypothetical protein
MFDFNTRTLLRRYTAADLEDYRDGGLTKEMIAHQNRLVGFDKTSEWPIRREVTFDALVFKQGQGPIHIGQTDYITTLKEEKTL